MKSIKILTSIVAGLSFFNSYPQCSMCRTQIVNNVSHGEIDLAGGLNTGIIYLFTAPYLLIGIAFLLWYRYLRLDEKSDSIKRSY